MTRNVAARSCVVRYPHAHAEQSRGLAGSAQVSQAVNLRLTTSPTLIVAAAHAHLAQSLPETCWSIG